MELIELKKAFNKGLNEKIYIDFIKFYSKMFKNGVDEAIYVYMQNKNIIAVTTYINWQKLGYIIKKDEKGIPVLQENINKIKYLFDISQTNKKQTNILWQYNKGEHYQLLLKHFNIEDKVDYNGEIQKALGGYRANIYNKLEDEDIEDKEFIFYGFYIATLKRLGLNINSKYLDDKIQKYFDLNRKLKIYDTFIKTTKVITNELFAVDKIITNHNKIKYQENQNIDNIKQLSLNDTNILDEEKGEHTQQSDVPFLMPKDREIVVGVGTSYNLFKESEIRHIKVKQVNEIRKIDGQKYILHKAINFEESKKVDALFDIKEDEVKRGLIPKDTISKNIPIKNDGLEVNIIDEKVKDIKQNYDIPTKNTLFSDLPKTNEDKINANLNAIKTLINIENGNRIATVDEQEILAKYVGFGGLPQVFEPLDKIKMEYFKKASIELKEMTTDGEYNSLEESTLNAHYTPYGVIENMYNALEHMGLSGKLDVLEPSCGTGKFIGGVTSKFDGSRFTGVEIDSISGRIARVLYPSANIKINGFEKENSSNKFDLVIGNVPFGNYYVFDREYNKNNLLVHDYFISKSIGMLRPNGIVAAITSKGTLDKKDHKAREEIAKKAELIGAIRLPNNAFKEIANTEVTTDILFFQKLESERSTEDVYWVHTENAEYENHINSYFIKNPHMILGDIEYTSNRYGRYDLTVKNNTDKDINTLINIATKNLPKNILDIKNIVSDKEDVQDDTSHIDIESIKNFNYKVIDNGIYYRENQKIKRISFTKINEVTRGARKKTERLKSITEIRDLARELINIQLDKYSFSNEYFEEKLKVFNESYDDFVKKYGYLNSKTNVNIFRQDDDIHFLTSLEKKQDDMYIKTDFFYKKVIAPELKIKEVESAKDSLILSLNKYGNINLEYMKSIYNKSDNEIIKELTSENLIFLNPINYNKDDLTKGWEITSIYINGNVKNKLKIAKEFDNPIFENNIKELEKVLPDTILFEDINIDFGSNLYKEEDYKQFTKELLGLYNDIKINYSLKKAEWKIYNKNISNAKATEIYGTSRIGTLGILENILNNKQIIVKDEIKDCYGNKRNIINKEETYLANEKRTEVENELNDFLFRNKNIRDRIENEYNKRFNNNVNTKFDIELNFPNISNEIELRQHQKNAIARSLFSQNNLLLDHQVGAGKTFIMIGSAMKRKQMGLSNKNLIVVPNNITEQFKNDFYKLYPNANILYASKKDFEKSNRKRFFSKILVQDYDAIIMGQSQFDMLKVSKERQVENIQKEIDEITQEMREVNEFIATKTLQRSKKQLEKTLKSLNDSNVETIFNFEDLGIDCIYIDEAHLYKNLHFTTKIRNVAGLNQTNSKRAFNLKMKLDYLKENDGKIIFSTGTPISNTMAEMYIMQKYLAEDKLVEMEINHFDSFISIFAKTETKTEVSSIGNKFQTKTRFSKFRNIPELMNIYNSFADVITTDMINLPVPKANYYTLIGSNSEELQEHMLDWSDRADIIKKGLVEPKVDNFLKLINEGRYGGLDIRHLDPKYNDYGDSKINISVKNILRIWEETRENNKAQVLFSDLSTPNENKFNIYDDIKQKLIYGGILENEIVFIHQAKTDKDREEIFEKVRNGEIKVLIGSTTKMGAGSNFQDNLIALHHLDTPWRPSDLEQREGRIVRQGNNNKEVNIYRYITKNSFDSYSWQILEQKQNFISQAKSGAITGRELNDIDDVTLSYAEIKALACGNPLIKEKMEIENEIAQLKMKEKAFQKETYRKERILKEINPKKIKSIEENIKCKIADNEHYQNRDDSVILIDNNRYNLLDEKQKDLVGVILIEKSKIVKYNEILGEYKGFKILSSSKGFDTVEINLKLNGNNYISLNKGYKKANIDLIEEYLSELPIKVEENKKRVLELNNEQIELEKEIQKVFNGKPVLEDLLKKSIEIEREINKDNDNIDINADYEEEQEEQEEQEGQEDEIEF